MNAGTIILIIVLVIIVVIILVAVIAGVIYYMKRNDKQLKAGFPDSAAANLNSAPPVNEDLKITTTKNNA